MNYIELSAKIDPLEIGREIMVAELAEVGFESFVDNQNGLKAYIQEELYSKELVKSLSVLHNANFSIEYSTKLIEDQNWNKSWEENFEPIEVGDNCLIRAPFHLSKNLEYEVIINPQMSFGTGHHETTFLMVKRMLSMDLKGLSVLDMGSGTGVLAILAKKMNASKIVAIDIDEWAYKNTIENVRNNSCEDIEVKKGGVEQIQGDTFNVILANINRNILLDDFSQYDGSLTKGGHILLSGFFKKDVVLLDEKAKSLGLELIHQESKNDWTLLHYNK